MFIEDFEKLQHIPEYLEDHTYVQRCEYGKEGKE